MCILCGCDYCDTIRGIGQVKAYQFIQKYHTIERVIENLPKDKYTVCICIVCNSNDYYGFDNDNGIIIAIS